jgi:hypothetical protein
MFKNCVILKLSKLKLRKSVSVYAKSQWGCITHFLYRFFIHSNSGFFSGNLNRSVITFFAALLMFHNNALPWTANCISVFVLWSVRTKLSRTQLASFTIFTSHICVLFSYAVLILLWSVFLTVITDVILITTKGNRYVPLVSVSMAKNNFGNVKAL